MVSLTTLVIAAIVAAIIYYFFNDDKPKGPGKPLPGPRGIPIFGSIFSLGMKPHRTLPTWIKNYGPIFGMKLANYNFVIIQDAKIAREAYNDPALFGRPSFEIFNILTNGGDHGITTTQGPQWQEQRRFTLRHLRDFGFGKSTLQTLVMDEVNEFMDLLKANEGKSFSPNRKFSLAVVNALWKIMTGKRFKQTDPELISFRTDQMNAFAEIAASPLALFYPEIAKAIPSLSGWGKIQKLANKFTDFISIPVNEHLLEYKAEETPRDFIDSYIGEIQKTTEPKSSFYKETGEKSLHAIVADLFGAGTETTGTTLSWAILFLTKRPQVMKKMQAEIDSVVGQSRVVTLEDRANMPYTEAVIYETLRKSSITPFGLYHSALETTTIRGYTIPKNSWVAFNQHFIHHDPEIWGDPEEFRPERFLSPDGKTVLKNENLVAFSVGKRVCIGEQIAKDSIFLFLTNIVQKYNIEFDKNLPEPTFEPAPGFFFFANIYNIVMKDRTV